MGLSEPTYQTTPKRGLTDILSGGNLALQEEGLYQLAFTADNNKPRIFGTICCLEPWVRYRASVQAQ